MRQSAIMIDAKDDVATALRRLEKGETIRIESEDHVLEVILAEAIPAGHKFVLTHFRQLRAALKNPFSQNQQLTSEKNRFR